MDVLDTQTGFLKYLSIKIIKPSISKPDYCRHIEQSTKTNRHRTGNACISRHS